MKRLLLFASCLLIGGFSYSCKKENVAFSVVKHCNTDKISADETVEIKLVIKRGKGYKGKFYIRCKQPEGNGMGTLTYKNVILNDGLKREVSADDIVLKYKAITDNYHKLDFLITNDHNKSEEFSVIFNKDKKDENDSDFSVTNLTTATTILADETVYIHLQLEKSNAYRGKYYLNYTQGLSQGLGELSYQNQLLQQGKRYEIRDPSIQMRYKAITENYHQLNFSISDDQNLYRNVSVILNEDKQGNDDYQFTASLPTLQKKIRNQEVVNFVIDFQRAKGYQGKYYIKYNQVKGNGVGELRVNGQAMLKTIPYEISGNEINMSYLAKSDSYHQLDITVYDDQNRKVNLTVVFNEELQGQGSEGFEITWFDFNPNISYGGTPVEFQLIQLDQEYSGKYFYRFFQLTGTTFVYEGDIKQDGSGLDNNQNYELQLDHNDRFSFYFHLLGGVNAHHEIKFIFFDEENNIVEHIIEFNRP